MGKGKKKNEQSGVSAAKEAESGIQGQSSDASLSSAEVQRPAKGDWKKNFPKKKRKFTPQQGEETEKDCNLLANPSTVSSEETVSNLNSSMMKLEISKLSMEEANFPQRKSVTEMGYFTTELISANYLDMNLSMIPDIIYHYDITFTPDRPKKFIFPAFKALINVHLTELLNKVAFDGVKSFYSMVKVEDADFPPMNVMSPDGTGKPKEFQISIKLAREIDMKVIKAYPKYNSPKETTIQQAIQTIDIIMKTAFDRDDLIRTKHAVFIKKKEENEKIIALEDNYELLIGLFQSFFMGARPLLNVDVSHKAFPSKADHLEPLYDKFRNFHSILNGLSLVYTHPITKERRTFKYNGIRKSPNEERFQDENKKWWTVKEYFETRLGAKLRYPGNPCIHVGPRDKKILIPMEFLSIPPYQIPTRPTPESCKPKMVKEAAGSTMQRKTKIMELLEKINYSSVSTIENFGLHIGKDFIKVKSHIIPPPMLEYRNKTLTINKPGEWRVNNEQFLISGKSNIKWGILILDKYVEPKHIEQFRKKIVGMAKKYGLEMNEFDPYCVEKCYQIDQLEKFFYEFKKKKVELLFVIIRDFTKQGEEDQHSPVKKAEKNFNLLTQCIKKKIITGRNGNGIDDAALYNILIKDNSKLGGTNHIIVPDKKVIVSINKRPFMLIGADVTHSSPGQKEIPSVVGVVASYDIYGFRYNSSMRLQKNRKTNKAIQEIIENFDEMVLEHLHFFKNKHKILPEHILYYRDGVSEGQFAHVKDIEVSAIKKACATMGKPNIQVTVIIVQKRHHTRFFPEKKTGDKNNNVTPGTVADSEIVDPEKWQFFMVSHISMQGVAKPTKYCIIHDDANLSNVELQVFTNNLCHLFTRCNRAVSYVAPTYYAHLVAARGRDLIQGENIDMENLEEENKKLKINPDFVNSYPMFFV